MKPAEAMRIVALLKDHFPWDPLTPEAVDLYALFFLDLDLQVASRVLAEWLASERRMPKIADVRERYEEAQGTLAPDVDLAWREVSRMLQKFGSRGMPPLAKWSHPAIYSAASSMGWESLCRSNNPAADRAHFSKFYEAAKRRHTRSTTTTGVQSIVGRLAEIVERGAPQLAPPITPKSLTSGSNAEDKPRKGGRRG